MNEPAAPAHVDGQVPSPQRQADLLAIQGLVVGYAFAVDDRDWPRWRTLFSDDATLDYTHSGGIAGGIDEVVAWMPDALSSFAWSLHSVLTHEIHFTGDDTASGRVHMFNRNGVEWNGTVELCDVGGVYVDEYRRDGDRWRFTRRGEQTHYITGGEFAAVVRDVAASTAPDRPTPIG
ncbi:MAG: nuclear transport factor 2 family protein [Actinomycetota bacterium]|nr:nuclear transport factor 2 family protein [Actinomycetota bacterium]